MYTSSCHKYANSASLQVRQYDCIIGFVLLILAWSTASVNTKKYDYILRFTFLGTMVFKRVAELLKKNAIQYSHLPLIINYDSWVENTNYFRFLCLSHV